MHRTGVRVFVSGFGSVYRRPEPIIDEGNPTSTAGILSIVNLCDILGRELVLDAPRARYMRGWGPNGTAASEITASWSLFLQDMEDQPTEIIFDVTRDASPIVIGMDFKKYSVTDNLSSPPTVMVLRPGDVKPRRLETYMTDGSPYKLRLRLLVVPVIRTTGLLGEARRPLSMRPLTLAKRIHNATHAHPEQMKRICHEAGWLTPELTDAIITVANECPSCAMSGTPAPSKKLSINHINQDFNEEVQVDFTYLSLGGKTHTAIHVVDVGTAYSELRMVDSRRADKLIDNLDLIWFYHHGMPTLLSADDEFNRQPIRTALKERSIVFKPRPTRRHNKCGIVERKNGTIKRILERLANGDTTGGKEIVVEKAVFCLIACMGLRR